MKKKSVKKRNKKSKFRYFKSDAIGTKKKTKKAIEASPTKRILNCVASEEYHRVRELEPGQLTAAPLKLSVDFRNSKWPIKDQKSSGACVGFATSALMEYHLTQKGKILNYAKISPRFIWQGSKETDVFTNYPETFIESSGTSLLAAVKIVSKFGSVLENVLSFEGPRYFGSTQSFYSNASKFRISNYYKIPINTLSLKQWISDTGPLLIAIQVNEEFMNCSASNPILSNPNGPYLGGHAICVVGYNEKGFIIRNSWGLWGDKGFCYMPYDYANAAILEAYGFIL